MVGALLLTLLVVAAPVSDDARAVGVLAVAGGATTLIVLGALSAHVGTLRQRLNERLVRHTLLGRMWPIFASAAEGLAGLRSARALAALSGWSVAVWTLNTLSYWTMLLALDLSLPLTAAMLIIVVTGLVAIVPSSPGYIGVFHFTIQQTLVQAYRVEPSIGLSYALLIHAVTYLGTTILGLLFLWREGLSLRNVAV
ncbi:MAG: flippase-like domain-containing protein [Chloroflexi bacterium]|nr:flippase-like domain-containing protein [Chloroflexota bacterium]